MFIKDIVNSEFHKLSEEETILSASTYMEKEKIRNLPVVNKDNKLTGLITLREIVDILSTHEEPEKILIKDAMLKQISSVEPTMPLKGAIEMMVLNKFSCLPVIDEDKTLFGFITESDLLKTLYDLAKKQCL